MNFLRYAKNAQKSIENISKLITGIKSIPEGGELYKIDCAIYNMVILYLKSVHGLNPKNEELVPEMVEEIMECNTGNELRRVIEEWKDE